MERSVPYLKILWKKINRKGRMTIMLLVAIIVSIAYLLLVRLEHYSTDTDIPIANTDSLYMPPKLNYSSIGNIHFRPNSMANVPLRHTGYMHQNGPLIINRTKTRSPNTIEIVFDKSLKKHFPKFPKCDSMCNFQFEDNHNKIAEYADSFVTDKRIGIINDAALHFNKVVFLPISQGLH
jgi:hypothetical protein